MVDKENKKKPNHTGKPSEHRKVVIDAFRRFLTEQKDEGVDWKPKDVAKGIWNETLELRLIYQDDIDSFWRANQQRLRDIIYKEITGTEHANKEHAQLFSGIEQFVLYHAPDSLTSTNNRTTVLKSAQTLGEFYEVPKNLEDNYSMPNPKDKNLWNEYTSDNVKAYRLIYFEELYGEDKALNCLALKQFEQDKRFFSAVWFNMNYATLFYKGFIIPARNIGVFRNSVKEDRNLLVCIKCFFGSSRISTFENIYIHKPDDKDSSIHCQKINSIQAQHPGPTLQMIKTVDENILRVGANLLSFIC